MFMLDVFWPPIVRLAAFLFLFAVTSWRDLTAELLGEFFDSFEFFHHVLGQHALTQALDIGTHGLREPDKLFRFPLKLCLVYSRRMNLGRFVRMHGLIALQFTPCRRHGLALSLRGST